MKPVVSTVVFALLCGLPLNTSVLQDSAPESRAAEVQADPKDVESIDAIIAALYDVISGPPGKARDWNRFRSLFVAEARLMTVRENQKGGTSIASMTPADYVKRAGPYLVKEGFFEGEVSRKTEAFGLIAHVFSTYESRLKSKDEKPFARGINSIQLMKDKDRWWVVSIYWGEESEKYPLPAEYLRK